MGANITTEHFDIAAYEKSVFAAADFYIPYEIGRTQLDRSAQIKQFKSGLRTAIGRMRPRNGEVLFAQYAGEKDRFFDLENMLFYNLGASAFAACAAQGIAFSALPDKAALCREVGIGDREYVYAYQCLPLAAVESRFAGLPLLAEWKDVPLDRREAGTLAKYWKALRRAGGRITAFGCMEPPASGRFALKIELHLPRPVKLANAIKPLLDGVVCAFHGADARCLDCLAEFCRREHCEELAVPRTFPAVLGEREVIRPYRNGQSFLWDPADDRCKLALVSASFGGETSSFSGKICML